ncbi:MAG: aa3-type cytochrome c oxidase subunit IV [Proteobacteria bacterium]|nr:aa3-type cytochrome c oxidase subunit IV [Pseudomonadota bacterium]
MAAHGNSGDYQSGSMDISQHVKAWNGFTAFVKWSTIGIILIMAFLAVFRTH